jgi:ABC-type transport system involved in multi-copper enzyme maturation permease subunit
MIDAIRAELTKMRTMPGVWVTFGLAFPLTALICLAVLASAGGFPGHTFYYVETLRQRRELLGAGYFGIEVLAPILGVLCITGEYRHKTITSTLVLTPIRTRVLMAKVVVTAVWAVFLALLSLAAVAVVGLPWNSALGGTLASVTDQVGAVVPGLIAAAILLALFGLGFGTLVKNQVAAILITIGGTLILEGILIALAKAIFHYNLNWLPNAAGAALAGDIARGFGGGNGRGLGFQYLTWWQGGLVMLLWGLVPLTIGYFTTFRRDVT